MNILFIYRYFWPDTAPYGNILKSIAEKMVSDGYRVTVFTGQPSYGNMRQKKLPKKDEINGINVIRVSLLKENQRLRLLRSINYFIFIIKIFIHNIINLNIYDLILVNSYPPIIMGFTAYLIKLILKKPYIYHCQDIHPESSLYAGIIKKNIFFNIMKIIDKKACQNANIVVTLSKDMEETIKKRGLKNKHIVILNNFILDVHEEALPVYFSEITNPNEFIILFAGNIGYFQGLESVIEAAKFLRENKKIKFIFMGEGSAKEKLKERSGDLLDKTIFFIPFQPLNKAFSLMKKTHLALISLKKNIYRVAYPSKTMMYVAAGCPLLVLVEKESELADLIYQENIGYVCSQKKPEYIAEKIKVAWENRDVLENNRNRITQLAHDQFGKERILDKWSSLIQKIS